MKQRARSYQLNYDPSLALEPETITNLSAYCRQTGCCRSTLDRGRASKGVRILKLGADGKPLSASLTRLFEEAKPLAEPLEHEQYIDDVDMCNKMMEDNQMRADYRDAYLARKEKG
jgi:hypothetical protein